uniref:ZZ-type domain-containing protein n=1 Tax=Spongospora subterranea TaxID=70186 RepID=A0A0H5R4U7_9EUKA|eukprot:CRZ03124.1 hypothetical protein [Spongospora subterranea]
MVNVYRNWRNDLASNVRLCSSSCMPFHVLGISVQNLMVLLHGPRDAHILKLDATGKRIGRIRLDLLLDDTRNAVRIVSGQWLTGTSRIMVATNICIMMFDIDDDNPLPVLEPSFLVAGDWDNYICDATIYQNRYLFAITTNGSVFVENLDSVTGQLSKQVVIPGFDYGETSSGSGVSIFASATSRRLICCWSGCGTRIFSVDDDVVLSACNPPLLVNTPSSAVTNDLRCWTDVIGSHDLIASIAPDSHRLVLFQVSDESPDVWCRTWSLPERGRQWCGLVDFSSDLRTPALLIQMENGSFHVLSEDLNVIQPQLVSVPSFQSFLDAPDPSSSRATGSGGGESAAWSYRDPTIFDRSKCVATVTVRGTSASKDFIRDVAKSAGSNGDSSSINKTDELAIMIEPEVPPGHCIVAVRALVDRSSSLQNLTITLPALRRVCHISVTPSSPKRGFDIPLCRFESAQLASVRDCVEVVCHSEPDSLCALLAIEVYAMPRSEFHSSTSASTVTNIRQNWPWPLPSQPESTPDFSNETLLGSALRLCLRICHITNGHWVVLQRILLRVLSVVGKPCFERLETLFHLLLMEVIPHYTFPEFENMASCANFCGRPGLRMFISFSHLHAQVCRTKVPSYQAGKLLIAVIDDGLNAIGKVHAHRFGAFLRSCPTFMTNLCEIASKLILTGENCHVFHSVSLLSSFFEFICESIIALAHGDHSQDVRDSFLQAPLEFVVACLACPYHTVRKAALERSVASFASLSQQFALRAATLPLEPVPAVKPVVEPAVSVSSDNDTSAPEHQQQRVTTILNSVNRSLTAQGTRYRCDLCDICPIIGPRYHCAHPDCVDFDLCVSCFGAGDFIGSTHLSSHEVVLLNDAQSSRSQQPGSHSAGPNVRLGRRRNAQHS